jgi:hypothetical protein
MAGDSSDDERAYTRRYTEDGINVVALDRHGRGLHRARPEKRFPTGRFTRPVEPPSSVLPTVLFVVLVVTAVVLAIGRLAA